MIVIEISNTAEILMVVEISMVIEISLVEISTWYENFQSQEKWKYHIFATFQFLTICNFEFVQISDDVEISANAKISVSKSFLMSNSFFESSNNV